MVIDDEHPGQCRAPEKTSRGRTGSRASTVTPGAAARYRHRAAEFLGPLAHDGQAVAVAWTGGDPAPSSLTVTARPAVGAGQRHVATPGADVPDHVGHRLDHDAYAATSTAAGSGGQVAGDVHADIQAGPARSAAPTACRWMRLPGRARPAPAAAALRRAAGRPPRSGGSPHRGRAAAGTPGRLRRQQCPRGLGLQGQPGQDRPEAIVQVTPQAAPSSSRASTRRSRVRCRSSRSSRACSAPPSCRVRSRTSRLLGVAQRGGQGHGRASWPDRRCRRPAAGR